MFQVLECNLHDMNESREMAEFNTRWEAEQYVDEHEGEATDHGYCLFIEGEDK